MKDKDLPLFDRVEKKCEEKTENSIDSTKTPMEWKKTNPPRHQEAIPEETDPPISQRRGRRDPSKPVDPDLQITLSNITKMVDERVKLRNIEEEKAWERRKREGIKLFPIKDEDGLKPYRVPLLIDQSLLFVHNRSTLRSREIGSVKITDPQTGEVVTCDVFVGKISKNDATERGVLKLKHKQIFSKLLRLWMQEGYPTVNLKGEIFGIIEKTLYFLVKFLFNISHPGQAHYRRLANLLLDMQSIPIALEGERVIEEQREFFGKFFTLILNTNFQWSSEPGRGQAGSVKILLHPFMTEMYFRGDKCLSTKLLQPCEELKSDIARLLYHYLDRILTSIEKFEKVLTDLIRDLGLSEAGYLKKSERKKLFAKAVKELCGSPLSSGRVLFVELQETLDQSDWKLVATSLERSPK